MYPAPKRSPAKMMFTVLMTEAFGLDRWNSPKREEEVAHARTTAPLGPTLEKFSPSAKFLSW
jgi:hypothetical protein